MFLAKDKIKFRFDNSRHLAINIDEVLIHELGGHKRRWDAINSMYELSGIDINDCKEKLETKLRTYVKNQMYSDTIYLKQVVSGNAYLGFVDKRNLNEIMADVEILNYRDALEDKKIIELVDEILSYDG